MYAIRATADLLTIDHRCYLQVISSPMDLGTVKAKLEAGSYTSMDGWAADVRLVFTNAVAYNGDRHEVGRLASQLLKKFEEAIRSAQAM